MTPVNSERAGSDVSELVERLRGYSALKISHPHLSHYADGFWEAATALERQARRIAVLEGALLQWASECGECGGTGIQRRVDFEGTPITDDPCGFCADIRAALEETQG